MVCILYLVGDGHLHKVPFALAVSVEVESDAGNALGLQLMSYALLQSAVSVAGETMA